MERRRFDSFPLHQPVFRPRGSVAEHSLGKGEVVSSILAVGTNNFRTVSAVVEHFLDMEEVAGSNPARSTTTRER